MPPPAPSDRVQLAGDLEEILGELDGQIDSIANDNPSRCTRPGSTDPTSPHPGVDSPLTWG